MGLRHRQRGLVIGISGLGVEADGIGFVEIRTADSHGFIRFLLLDGVHHRLRLVLI